MCRLMFFFVSTPLLHRAKQLSLLPSSDAKIMHHKLIRPFQWRPHKNSDIIELDEFGLDFSNGNILIGICPDSFL